METIRLPSAVSRVQTLASAKKPALRRVRGAHEVFIHATGGLAAFRDGPDNEGLAATHIARAEDSWDGGHVDPQGRCLLGQA